MSKKNDKDKYSFWLEVVRYVVIVTLILAGCGSSVGLI